MLTSYWNDQLELIMQPWRQAVAVVVLALPTITPWFTFGGKVVTALTALLFLYLQFQSSKIKRLELQKLEYEVAEMKKRSEEDGA